jgi:putative transport protein
MKWFVELLTQHGIAQTVIIYGLLIAIGITLGKVRVKGISLGVTWILFAGLAVSYAGISVDKALMYFLRDFGLILFVYSIGLQVAPGYHYHQFFSDIWQPHCCNDGSDERCGH